MRQRRTSRSAQNGGEGGGAGGGEQEGGSGKGGGRVRSRPKYVMRSDVLYSAFLDEADGWRFGEREDAADADAHL